MTIKKITATKDRMGWRIDANLELHYTCWVAKTPHGVDVAIITVDGHKYSLNLLTGLLKAFPDGETKTS